MYEDDVYDLTDYIFTNTQFSNQNPNYLFLDSDIVDVFKQQAGQDVTKTLGAVLAKKDANTVNANMACLKNMFFVGENDFRKTPRCEVQNILLLAFSVIVVTTIAAKCMYFYFFSQRLGY